MAIHEMQALTALMQRDPEYAWAWHCNLAMPIMDATDCSPEKANQAAAHLMQHLFGVDMTRDERFTYGKSGAQQYAEFRLAADREEDARIGAETERTRQSSNYEAMRAARFRGE